MPRYDASVNSAGRVDGRELLGSIAGTVDSAVPGLTWPAIPRPAVMATLALHDQLSHSQWWSPERLEAMQFRQLALLLGHAKRTVPHFQRSLPVRRLDRELLHAIPVLTRSQLQKEPAAFASSNVPVQHLPLALVRSSGSTGRPIELKITRLTSLIRRALYLREHVWHRRDLSLAAATIRNFRDGSGMPPAGKRSAGWGYGYATRPISALNIRASVDEQLRWLQQVQPAYLTTFPTNLRALALEGLERGIRLPGLREVCTYAESPPPGLPGLVRRAFDAGVVDIYSSEETGPIAFQCPKHAHYHVQSENLVVEVLDDTGRACRPGEVGRVVITDLHNFATPLIRYQIGDHAELGPPCDCGRGLPVLARILGRTRSMLRMGGGRLRWPSLPSGDKLGSIAPVRQFQLVQKDFERLDLRLVVARALTRGEEERVRAAFLGDLGGGFTLALTYTDAIARNAGGKYEDFRCEME